MFQKLKSLVVSHWLLVVIIIIASFLRLYNLTVLPPGLYPDEAMNGNNAVEALRNNDWKVFYPENFGREGLFINIQSLFVAAFGNQPWALRLPSAIFGILTVLGLYFFTKELFSYENTKTYESTKLALLSSFLLATSFWHINFSRIGFRAIMASAFLAWALYFLLLSLRKAQTYSANINLKSEILISKSETNPNNKNSNFRNVLNFENFDFKIVSNLGFRASCFAILAGLLYGLGFHSYIAYRATPLLLLFLMAIIWRGSERKKELSKIFGIFILFTFLAGLPLGIYFLENPADFLGRTAGISIFNSETPIADLALNSIKTLGMFNFVGDFNWRHNIAGRPLLFWPVGIMFLVGLYFAIKNLIQNVKIKNQNDNLKSKINPLLADTETFNFAFLTLIFWLIVGLLPVVLSSEGLPHALRSIIVVPPVFILSALGGMKVYNLLISLVRPKLIIHASLFIILSLLALEAYFSYFVTWGENPNVKNAFAYNDYVIARQLNNLPAESPKYIIVSGADRKIERDYPISLQSILFLTDTFAEEKRQTKNLFYLTPQEFEAQKIPGDAFILNL